MCASVSARACVCVCEQLLRPHRASVLHDAVGEAAVALGSDLHVVGALQQQRLLQVARGGVQVGHAVPAVVGEVLGRLGGQQPQEGHLDGGRVGRQAVVAVAELRGAGGGGAAWMWGWGVEVGGGGGGWRWWVELVGGGGGVM